METGAATLFKVLDAWGVTHVPTCPGSTEAAFLDQSLAYPQVPLVLTTHESIAISMADGTTRATKAPAVAYLHTNVGLANSVAHLSSAWLANSPVVVLNGLKHQDVQHHTGFTTAPYMRDHIRQYTKFAVQVKTRSRLVEDLNRALQVATTEPSGPVWVGLPEDVMTEQAESTDPPDVARYRLDWSPRCHPEALEKAAEVLGQAKRPLIVAGDDAARREGGFALIRLAEALGCPVMSQDAWSAQWMVFPTAHPLNAGTYHPDRPSVAEADVILLAGTGFRQYAPSQHPAVPTGPFVIHCHSDSTRVGQLHGADLGLVGDVGPALQDLANALEGMDGRGDDRDHYVSRTKAESLHRQHPTLTEGIEGLDALTVIDTLDKHIDDNSIVVGDAITNGEALFRGLTFNVPARYFTSAAGSMGWALGAALGVQLADRSAPVVAVVGDGVFQFGLPGLWTAVRYELPVVLVILNNQKYAAVEEALHRYGGQAANQGMYPGTDISGPDLAAISRGFGASGFRVSKQGELVDALLAALTQRSMPTVIEAMLRS